MKWAGDKLIARIAELEAENERLQIAYDVQKAATCQFVIVSAEDGPKAVDEGMAKAYQVASEQKSRANDAEAELAALNRMLYWVWVQHFGNVTFEDWLADLRTRAEEGRE